MFKNKLVQVKEEIIRFMRLCKLMLNDVVRGLEARDVTLLIEVISNYESQANELECEIDELCTHVIAQFEPKAIELRQVLMFLKMNNDLERIGDHCVNIAESAQYLIQQKNVDFEDLFKMATYTEEMLSDSMLAHMEHNVSLASKICKRDQMVDDLQKSMTQTLIKRMISDSSSVNNAMHLLRIVSNLERIADLTTNLSEEIIFIENGRVIKHHREEL